MPWEDIRDDLAFVDEDGAGYYEEVDACAWLHGLVEGRAVGDGCGIEDDYIGVGALLQSAFLTSGGSGAFEHLGGHEAHFSKGVHKGDGLFFADVLGEDAGVGSGVPWVAFGAVAGDHDEWVRDDFVDYLL